MTEPQRAESPFASIRELTAAERRITTAMLAMKEELLEAIRSSNTIHEATHDAMRVIGDNRHRRIDDFLGKEALDDAKRTGMMTATIYTIRALRVLNEFRWLLAAALVILALVLNDAHLSLTVQ